MTHQHPISISVKELSVKYQNIMALRQVTFDIRRGARVAIVGPNGAGKSTLFKAIAGTLKAQQGEIKLFGENPLEHACVAYLPQRSQIDLNFPVNVTDVVMMGRVGKMGILRWPSRADRDLVATSLESVGMTQFATRHISELSGGQLQRVFIARAIAQKAEIVLMDEPLTGLDITSQSDIYGILDKLREHKVTVLVATHDLNQAAERFDAVMLLNKQLVGFGLPTTVFTPLLLQQAYGGTMQFIEITNGQTALIRN